MSNIQKGRFGEEIAWRYLQSLGYQLLHRNWTCRWGELDLIVEEDGTLVFVEVKYAHWAKIRPQDQFTPRKQRNLLRTIGKFMLKQPDYIEWRLDLICLTRNPGRVKISHYKNVLMDC